MRYPCKMRRLHIILLLHLYLNSEYTRMLSLTKHLLLTESQIFVQHVAILQSNHSFRSAKRSQPRRQTASSKLNARVATKQFDVNVSSLSYVSPA